MSKVSTDLHELLSAYRDAAERHGIATEEGNPEVANSSAERLGTIYSEIRRRGLPAQTHLLSLLSDPVPGVRCWAAAHALEFSPTDGERVLGKLASQKGLIGLSAKMTLSEWRAGRLRFP